MKILLVKLTSMGDVVHVLPAISDIALHFPDAQLDCLVEDTFVDIVQSHPKVSEVIPAATRKWRRFNMPTWRSFSAFLRILRNQEYDYIIDTQGLMKSAALVRLARISANGVRCGYDKAVLKETLASWCYNKKYHIPRQQHAIVRIRQLVAASLGYSLDTAKLNYGVQIGHSLHRSIMEKLQRRSVMFAHGTTKNTKHIPEHYWESLVQIADKAGFQVVLTWGNEKEKARAHRLAKVSSNTYVVDRLPLVSLWQVINACQAVIAVDTGIGHMAAAIGKKCVSIYRITDPHLVGAMGQNQIHMQLDCDSEEDGCTISANDIWRVLNSS